MLRSFRDLNVYKESFDLMIILHKIVHSFPLYEKNDLSSQIRRASKSIPANIAEGWAKRNHEKEFKRHLDSAIGSANEMEVHIETALRLGYVEKSWGDSFLIKYRGLGAKLFVLRKNWKTYNKD